MEVPKICYWRSGKCHGRKKKNRVISQFEAQNSIYLRNASLDIQKSASPHTLVGNVGNTGFLLPINPDWSAGYQLSGYQNWKANQALFGQKVAPWFRGGAFETPLTTCCSKDARLEEKVKNWQEKGKTKTRQHLINHTKSIIFPQEQQLFLQEPSE